VAKASGRRSARVYPLCSLACKIPLAERRERLQCTLPVACKITLIKRERPSRLACEARLGRASGLGTGRIPYLQDRSVQVASRCRVCQCPARGSASPRPAGVLRRACRASLHKARSGVHTAPSLARLAGQTPRACGGPAPHVSGPSEPGPPQVRPSLASFEAPELAAVY
jgi:hypothetical protein